MGKKEFVLFCYFDFYNTVRTHLSRDGRAIGGTCDPLPTQGFSFLASTSVRRSSPSSVTFSSTLHLPRLRPHRPPLCPLRPRSPPNQQSPRSFYRRRSHRSSSPMPPTKTLNSNLYHAAARSKPSAGETVAPPPHTALMVPALCHRPPLPLPSAFSLRLDSNPHHPSGIPSLRHGDFRHKPAARCSAHPGPSLYFPIQ
jgi:hypothetical protein